MTYISFFILNFSATVGPDFVGATWERTPELPSHEADDRRALVEAVIARHDLEHLQIARRRREGADLDFALHHIQILYKTCIERQAAFLSAGGGRSLRQR